MWFKYTNQFPIFGHKTLLIIHFNCASVICRSYYFFFSVYINRSVDLSKPTRLDQIFHFPLKASSSLWSCAVCVVQLGSKSIFENTVMHLTFIWLKDLLPANSLMKGYCHWLIFCTVWNWVHCYVNTRVYVKDWSVLSLLHQNNTRCASRWM